MKRLTVSAILMVFALLFVTGSRTIARQRSNTPVTGADGRAVLTDPPGDIQPIVHRERSTRGPDKETTYPGFDVVKMTISSDGKALTFGTTLNTEPAQGAVYPVLEFHVDADNNRKTGITHPDAVTLAGMEFHGLVKLCVDPLTCQSSDTLPAGTIARLLIDHGFGFVRDEAGIEHFFHRSAVRGSDFKLLEVGQRVKFAVDTSGKGPRASVVVVDTNRPRGNTDGKGHTAIVTLEKYGGGWTLKETLIDLPATGNAKEPTKTPVAGAIVQAAVDYTSLRVKSGQTIRLVVREYCAGKIKNVTQGFFPEIVLTLR